MVYGRQSQYVLTTIGCSLGLPSTGLSPLLRLVPIADGGAVFGRLSLLRVTCLGRRGGVGVGGRASGEQMTASELALHVVADVEVVEWDNEDSSDLEDDDGRLLL